MPRAPKEAPAPKAAPATERTPAHLVRLVDDVKGLGVAGDTYCIPNEPERKYMVWQRSVTKEWAREPLLRAVESGAATIVPVPGESAEPAAQLAHLYAILNVEPVGETAPVGRPHPRAPWLSVVQGGAL